MGTGLYVRAMGPQERTYRALRLAMLALLLALGVSIAAETARTGWQTSVSGYYYTAAGPVFIGVLVALGVCLVALQGFTDAEEVCLNLAGISAPMVAFVPTPVPDRRPDVHAIENNALTFLTVLAVGYVVTLLVGVRRRRRGRPWPSRWGLVGFLATAVAWAVGVTWLLLDRAGFAAHAHALAAVFTFVPFAGVVVLNTDWGVRVLAREAASSRTRFDRPYWLVVAGMAAAALAAGVTWIGWQPAHTLLALEIVLLGLFALFWALQTIDLDSDLAGDPDSDPTGDLPREPTGDGGR